MKRTLSTRTKRTALRKGGWLAKQKTCQGRKSICERRFKGRKNLALTVSIKYRSS